VVRCRATLIHGIPIGSYTTAIPTQKGILEGLTRALKEKLKKNAIVITTDYQVTGTCSCVSNTLATQ
jgi:hypothetical protein